MKISASAGEIVNNKALKITFSHEMQQTPITASDISVIVITDYKVDFTWSAKYLSLTELEIRLVTSTALQGSEVLNVKLANFKKFRTPTGG